MAQKRPYSGIVDREAASDMRSITIQLSAGDLAALLSTDFRGLAAPHRQFYEALHNGVAGSGEAVREEPPNKKIKHENCDGGSFDLQIHYIWRSAEDNRLEQHVKTIVFKVYENNRIEDLFSKVEDTVPYSRFGSVSCLYKDDKCIYRPDTIDLEPDFGNTLTELGINRDTVLLFGPADDEVFEEFEHEDAADLHHDIIEAQQRVEELADDVGYGEEAETNDNGVEGEYPDGDGLYEAGYVAGEGGAVDGVDEDFPAGDGVYEQGVEAGPHGLADPFVTEEAPINYPEHTGLYQAAPALVLPVEYYDYPQAWP